MKPPPRTRFALAAVVALTAGCATFQPQPFELDSWHDQLAQQQFRAAERSLTTAALPDEQRQLLQQELLQAVSDYQSALLTELGQLAERRQFNRADQLILEAETKFPAALPRSASFEQFLSDYHALRATEEQSYLDHLLLLRGDHLLAERKHINPLRAFASSPRARGHIERHDESVREVGAQLAERGREVLAAARLERAARYLSLAQQLRPRREVAAFLEQAEAARTVEAAQRARVAQQALQQTYDKLYDAARQALADGDFAGARSRVDQMKRLAPSFKQSDELLAEIDATVARQAAELMEEGDKWYADGSIERALRVWRRAHELTPTPQLADRVARAERFLDRYREIKNGGAEPTETDGTLNKKGPDPAVKPFSVVR